MNKINALLAKIKLYESGIEEIRKSRVKLYSEIYHLDQGENKLKDDIWELKKQLAKLMIEDDEKSLTTDEVKITVEVPAPRVKIERLDNDR